MIDIGTRTFLETSYLLVDEFGMEKDDLPQRIYHITIYIFFDIIFLILFFFASSVGTRRRRKDMKCNTIYTGTHTSSLTLIHFARLFFLTR
jgi:hypothetical protein